MISKVAAILCNSRPLIFCTDCELDHIPQRISGMVRFTGMREPIFNVGGKVVALYCG